MVCDDALFMRNTLKEFAEKEGYHCTGQATNGLDLLKEIKEKHLSTKVILITADNTPEAVQSAASYGADAYVTKPFYPNILGLLFPLFEP